MELLTANYHTHTSYCRHASGTVGEYVRAAIGSGIKTLGFSDHCPYPFPDGYYSFFRMYPSDRDDYVREVLACREKYADKIDIRIGYEAEYYPRHFGELLKMINGNECEYIILGQHFLNNEYDGVYSGDDSDDEAKLKQYVDQVCEAMELGVFTYLCHPELIAFNGDDGIYEEHMTRLVEVAVRTDTPLEINLRGIKYGCRYPSERFLRLAAPLGPKFIIGVDAHEPDDLRVDETYSKAFDLVKKYGLDLLDHAQFKKPVL